MFDFGTEPAVRSSTSSTRATPTTSSARGGRHRLQDEPVQHRRRRPVPARRVRWPPPSAAPFTCPGRCTSLVIVVVADGGRRRLGGHRRRAQGHPRRQRGHLHDHAQRHRHRRSSPTCSRTDKLDVRPGSNNIGDQADRRRPGSCPGISTDPGQRHRGLRLHRPRRRSSGSATPCCSAAPASASTCGPPAVRVGGRGQRRERQAHDAGHACCSPGRSPAWSACRSCSGVDPHATRLDFPTGLGFTGIAIALLGPQPPGRHRVRRAAAGRSSTAVAQILDLEEIPKEIVQIMQGVDRALGRRRLRAGPPVSARGQEQRRRRDAELGADRRPAEPEGSPA